MFVLQGDKLEIVIVNADGIRREYAELRKDWSIKIMLLDLLEVEVGSTSNPCGRHLPYGCFVMISPIAI
jgi:hypothetical protein